MAVLEILTYPDARLKELSRPVESFNDKLQEFILDLEETLRAGPGAVGIAAPQVGRLQRIILVDVSGKRGVSSHGFMVLVNPEITEWEGFELGREGCLSVPDFTGNVIRAKHIRVDALDARGVPTTYECVGFEARAVQHELDHLDGMLFLDRLVSRRNDLFHRKVYRKDRNGDTG